MSADLITIVRGASRNFYADICYPDSDTPVDLSDAEAIEASFPSVDGTGVLVTMEGGGIAILGAPGAGRVSILLETEDTEDMAPNPGPTTMQDLQIEVKKPGGNVVVAIMRGVLNIMDPVRPLTHEEA